jgi:Domain of unknown function (DUF4124)
MKTWLVLLGCLLAFTSSAQSTRREVWQWKDANGVTHFSDNPAPGARKIVLNGSPASTAATSPSSAAAAARSPARPAATEVVYDRLEIWSPENNAAFFTPDAEIVIRVRSEPSLDQADRLVTYVDGKQLPDVNALEHRLTGLSRGAHTIASAIYGRDGTEKIRSTSVVFHMKLPSLPNPRSQGPAVRPPQPRAGG